MEEHEETNDTVSLLSRERLVKDPVHDYIILHSKSWAFIDTVQFQRLRSLKQLGVTYYVWPGASHNRFEHSLGVAHLARMQAESLQKNQPELKISDRDVECVELAGLCHDLGHGPWSHVWDSMIIPAALPGTRWQHEDASEMMFDHLRAENSIEMSEKDADFIKALIAGDPKRCGYREKPFLFEIVANKRNGIDVDKFDYIGRDTHAIGEKINISWSRLIRSARVIDDQICYDIKDANHIYEIFYTRFSLHKRIYNHKSARAIEYMLVDAMIAADRHLKFIQDITRPERYVYLTDDIWPHIERSTEPELQESRAILERIRTRDLYKCVDFKILGFHLKDVCEVHITSKHIVEAARAWASTVTHEGADVLRANAASLQPSDVIIDMSTPHYGMREKNPMDSVKFYSKHSPNQCAQAEMGDISTLMPPVFAEVLLRIYTRQAKYFGIIQAGYRRVLETMPKPSSPVVDDTRLFVTDTAPSTPKTRSSDVSLSDIGGSPSFGLRALSPFRNNSFTTVPPSFVPPPPKSKRERVHSAGEVALNRDKRRKEKR